MLWREEVLTVFRFRKKELVNKFNLMRTQKQDIYRNWNIEDLKEVLEVIVIGCIAEF